MAAPFKVEVVTPEKALPVMENAVSLQAPAYDGYLGVLAGHAPMVAELVPGEITIKLASGPDVVMATSGGYLEVTNDGVTVMADTAELPDDIDIERARAAYRRAADRLAGINEGIDLERARAAMQRAMSRLKVTGNAPR